MIDDVREVLRLLRDFSFKVLVTPLVIRVLYRIGVIAAAFLVFMQILNAFAVTEGRGIVVLLLGIFVLFPFYVMVLRVVLEIVMALFYKASGTPIVVATQAGDVAEPTVVVEEPVADSASPPTV